MAGRSQEDVGQNEQKASAAVRDIQETLEVLLVQQTDEGMFLLDGRRLDDVESKEIAQQLIRIPIAITPSPNKIVQAITDLEELTNRFFLGLAKRYLAQGGFDTDSRSKFDSRFCWMAFVIFFKAGS